MLSKILVIILSSLSLLACKAAEIHNFVHEDTELDRMTLQWSNSDPELISELAEIELPYLVVDFYSFWPGYSATAYLYVVQRDDEPIEIESVEVKSAETGEVHTLPLDMEASPKPLKGKLRLFRYRILDAGAANRFDEASSLHVTIKWLDRNETERSSEFRLQKKEKSDVAWPT